jgi:SAM-dependent methyltransferase
VKVCVGCGFGPLGDDWRCPACGRRPESSGGIVYFAPELRDGDGTDAAYPHEALLRAEETHFWFRGRSKLLLWALARHFPGASSLLDVGCGRGTLLADARRAFPSMALAGGEALDAGLRLARARLDDVALYQIDARRLPFEREFDVVTSCDVLEHLDDDEAAARELYRVTAPGGGAIITVPQHQWLWSAVDTFSHHRRRYTRRQLGRVMEQAGFVVERTTSFISVLLPLFLASRLRKRSLTADFDFTAELKVAAWTNAVLERALDGERRMIEAGVSLPVGSSLLLIARRPAA